MLLSWVLKDYIYPNYLKEGRFQKNFYVPETRVSDPCSFFPDPDPAFEAGDQSVSGSNPDPDPIRIQGFNDQKLKKMTAEKKIKLKLKI
jgi:hypothetical protein